MLSQSSPNRLPELRSLILALPQVLSATYSIHLAIFFLRGSYHSIGQRISGAPYISSQPPNPLARPPSYALLGLLMLIRVAHQVTSSLFSRVKEAPNSRLSSPANLGKLPEMSSYPGHSMQPRMPQDPNDKDMYIDSQPVASLLAASTEAGKLKVIM